METRYHHLDIQDSKDHNRNRKQSSRNSAVSVSSPLSCSVAICHYWDIGGRGGGRGEYKNLWNLGFPGCNSVSPATRQPGTQPVTPQRGTEYYASIPLGYLYAAWQAWASVCGMSSGQLQNWIFWILIQDHIDSLQFNFDPDLRLLDLFRIQQRASAGLRGLRKAVEKEPGVSTSRKP